MVHPALLGRICSKPGDIMQGAFLNRSTRASLTLLQVHLVQLMGGVPFYVPCLPSLVCNERDKVEIVVKVCCLCPAIPK